MNAFRLLTFVVLLLPAFAIMFGRYFLSSNIKRRIPYGNHGRNFIDVYLPTDDSLRTPSGWPVVIYFTGSQTYRRWLCRVSNRELEGGAWIIGHRAWGSIMGWEMARKGVLFVSADYRSSLLWLST